MNRLDSLGRQRPRCNIIEVEEPQTEQKDENLEIVALTQQLTDLQNQARTLGHRQPDLHCIIDCEDIPPENIEDLHQQINVAQKTVDQLKIPFLENKLNTLRVKKDDLREALIKVENEINALKLRDNDDGEVKNDEEVKEAKVDEFEIPHEIQNRISTAMRVFENSLELVKVCQDHNTFESIVFNACDKLTRNISEINKGYTLSINTFNHLVNLAHIHLESVCTGYVNGKPSVWKLILNFTHNITSKIPDIHIGNDFSIMFFFNILNKMRQSILSQNPHL